MTLTYEEHLVDLLSDIKKMLLAKHHDYGTNNLKKRGLPGIMVRLDDKIARIDNLLMNQENVHVEDESIVNTFIDIAGYAIQAILLEEGKL